ncbi:MAG: ferritin [Deferribacteres bacterium]|nr:ferritin [candidate division KSB1 bacterium]MCB9510068.1 ferritin [Deferribacteres bacterium]
MLSTKMENALNEQIKNEFSSSFVYLAMSAYCDEQNLAGFAHWLRMQSQEEYGHAMKIFNYIQDREGHVVLKAIPQPESQYGSLVEVFKETLEHEKTISQMINELYALAVEEKDYPTQVMLQWFINEQVEEEKTASDILAQVKMIGDNTSALIVLDQQLASRSPESEDK